MGRKRATLNSHHPDWPAGLIQLKWNNPTTEIIVLATLPLSVVETLLTHSLGRRPKEANHNLREWDWERWKDSLRVWRETLGALGDEQLIELAQSKELWDQAIRTVPERAWKKDVERIGDWDQLPEVLEEEVRLWKKEGLIPQWPSSSTELPALALISLARKYGVEWGDVDERVMSTLLTPSPTVLKALLDMAPSLDVEPLLLRPSPHHSAYSIYTDTRRVFAHDVFDFSYLRAGRVLVEQGRFPVGLARALDHQGLSPLAYCQRDITAAKQWLDLGADPNALDVQGKLPDELETAYLGESVLEFHDLLQKHRSEDQARVAHKRFTASSLARVPFATTQESGVFDEVVNDPIVDLGDEKIGILSYMERIPEDRVGDKERLTTLARLLTGKARAGRVLAAEGSEEKGLAVALSIAGRMSSSGWLDRKRTLAKALAPHLKTCNRGEVVREAIQRSGLHTVTGMARALGPSGLLANGLNDIAIEDWGHVLAHMVEDVSSWAWPPGSRKDNSKDLLSILETAERALTQNGEHQITDEQKSQWMAGLMALSLAVDETHPAFQRVIKWIGTGIEPQWPSLESREKVGKWVEDRFPSLNATRLSLSLEQGLPPASHAPKRGARL